MESSSKTMQHITWLEMPHSAWKYMTKHYPGPRLAKHEHKWSVESVMDNFVSSDCPTCMFLGCGRQQTQDEHANSTQKAPGSSTIFTIIILLNM